MSCACKQQAVIRRYTLSRAAELSHLFAGSLAAGHELCYGKLHTSLEG